MTTAKLIKIRFSQLCEKLDKSQITYENNKSIPGSWYIDNAPIYGGYEILEIVNDMGGVRQINGWCNRMKPKEFLAYLEGALMTLEVSEGKRKS